MSSTSPLQLVHSDVWGPVRVTSTLGYKYYVIFIDDFTRFTWLFLLKHKSEAFIVFLHFKAFVENQFESKIKILRIDGWGEYVTNQFKSFCLDHDINISCHALILLSKMVLLRESISTLLKVVFPCFISQIFLLLIGVMP